MNKEIELQKIIEPYLTNFKGNEYIFQKAFENNNSINCPIKNILELGVHHGENPLFGGQSTKAFYKIYNLIKFDKLYSLDLDHNCNNTIDIIKNMFQDYECPPNELIVENSLDYNPNLLFDFIFLDTNHDSTALPIYYGTNKLGGPGFTFLEIEKYSKLLTTNGRFFLHDTKNFYCEKVLGHNTEGAVMKFINENPDWAFIEHNTNENGLGELININSEIYKFLQSETLYQNWKNDLSYLHNLYFST